MVAGPEPGRRTSDLRPRTFLVLSLAVVALATVLRALRLDAAEPWLDEACTVHYATLPWDAFVRSFSTESHPPFYYVAMKAWIAVAGLSPSAVRLPSLAAGVAAVVLAIRLGRRWLGDGGGLVAGFILAVSPLAIHYSVEARQLMPAACLALAAIERFDAWCSSRRRLDAVAWAVVATAALYTHYYVAFVLPWVPAARLLASRDRRLPGWLLAALPLALFAPWPLVFAGGHVEGGSKAWIEEYRTGAIEAVGTTVATLGGPASFPAYLGALGALDVPGWVARAGPVASALLLAAGLGAAARSRAPAGAAIAAWAVLPVAVPLAVSAALRPIYLPGRYEVIAIPAFALAMAAAVAAPGRVMRWTARAAGCAWIAGVVAVHASYLPLELQRPTSLVHDLLARERDGVAAVEAVGFAWAPFEYRERLDPAGVPIDPVPRGLVEHPGWWDVASPPDAAGLAPPPSRPGAVWLVTLRGDGFRAWADAQAARLLESGYRADRTIDVGDVRLRVFRHRESGVFPLPSTVNSEPSTP